MALARFVGGPWDGQTREIDPDPHTGTITEHVLYGTDSGGHYLLDPETVQSQEPPILRWQLTEG